MSTTSHAGPKAFSVSIVHDDAYSAGQEAAQELRDGLGSAPELVMFFFSTDFDAVQVTAGLRSGLPASTQVIGCSSYAEVGQDEALTHSVTALGMRLPGVRFQTFSHPKSAQSSAEVGRQIGEELRALRPELVFMFPDALTQNVTQVLKGLQAVLGESLLVVGGAPGDNGSFTKTFQVRDGEVYSGGVCGVAMRGGIQVATAAVSGYQPAGISRKSTLVENGNVLLQLDGQPALQVYRDFLGSRASAMPAVSIEFPLGVFEDSTSEQPAPSVVRAIFAVDEKRQALILGGDIPQVANIRVLRAGREDVLKGAETATAQALAQQPQPEVAFLFNCMSRKVVLGPRYKEECAATYRLLPKTLPRIGFYTFGELSPQAGTSVHHESTFTLALVRFAGESA